MTTNNSWNSETIVGVVGGGTGRASHTEYAVICGGTTSTSAQQSIVSVGTATQVLTSNGAGALPTFQDATGGSGTWTKISTQSVSADVATVDFTGIDGTYDFYVFELMNVTPATDGAFLYLRVGTGAGPTYQSGASDYRWTNITSSDTADSEIELTAAVDGATAGDGVSCEIIMCQPDNSSLRTSFEAIGGYLNSAAAVAILNVVGRYTSTTAVTAVRFLFSTGDIDYGIFTLYGVSNS